MKQSLGYDPTSMPCLYRSSDGWKLKNGDLYHQIPQDLVEDFFKGIKSAPDLLAGRGRQMEAREMERLLPPLWRQEIWGAGVTYARSQAARVGESQGAASLYDKVYTAQRPHLFFKGLAWKAGGHGDDVGFREDSTWCVPEPELALVIAPQGKVIGVTLGNDATARDIEGSNPLYLSQAKIFEHSVCIGPGVLVFDEEPNWKSWKIRMEIERGRKLAFEGEVELSQMKRSWQELVSWLFRCERFPDGAVLLTGTGIVPPDDYRMEDGDVVRIRCEAIGTLVNVAKRIRVKTVEGRGI